MSTIVKAGVTAGLMGVGTLNAWRCPHCKGGHEEGKAVYQAKQKMNICRNFLSTRAHVIN
ncbi:MAG: hypothetical protein LBE99_03045 [Puniceicoccales bacterium]|nr:hypothetical protein [Puniceicoccales bacterium]